MADEKKQRTALEILESIDATLKRLVPMLRVLTPKPVATANDLDGQYGNPTIKFNPKDWLGADFRGRKMSECPAGFLDKYAEVKDYFGDQAEATGKTTAKGKPTAPYERQDAARARGWAQRIRDGKHVQTTDTGDDHDQRGADDDDWASGHDHDGPGDVPPPGDEDEPIFR